MKAKELAEQLLKYPDFEVEFDIVTKHATIDHPWADIVSFKVDRIADIGHSSKVITLDVSEVQINESKTDCRR